MSRVVIRDLVKRYGKVLAVDHASFEVADGEFVAILGPSGCGKTSTLRMIAGLEMIDGGEVRIGDRVVNRLDPAERNVAMAFENYGLYPHWSCFDNIAYPLRLRDVRDSEISQKVRRIAEQLQIDEVLDLRPAGLSGGIQQRVGLARALVREPEVFLLDEPMSHVEPELRSQLREQLKRIHQELGATMIYVTHDQLEAMALANRIVVMNNAVVQQIGTPNEVFNHPENAFVAGFVGEPAANFLPGTVAIHDGAAIETVGGARITPPHGFSSWAAQNQGSAVTIGVRPHRLGITYQASPDSIPGRVYVVEPLGDRTVVSVSVGDAVIKVETQADFAAELDTPVWLTVGGEHVMLFDSTSGHVIHPS